MSKTAVLVIYVPVMVAIIVGVDLLFFRSPSHSLERLMSNIGIVLLFGAFYLRFMRP